MATYHIEAWPKGKETEQPIEEWVEAPDIHEALNLSTLPDGEYSTIKITKVEVN
jgi:hypothetical protein